MAQPRGTAGDAGGRGAARARRHRGPGAEKLGLDADGHASGDAAHLMEGLPADADAMRADRAALHEMAAVLAAIHDVRPRVSARRFQSWSWEAKRVVPPFASDADTWRRAFAVLAAGVVDWVETSTGPAWLDVAHGASNLALPGRADDARRRGRLAPPGGPPRAGAGALR